MRAVKAALCLIMVTLLLLPGCSLRKTSPDSAREELISRDRKSADGRAALSFENDKAVFRADAGDDKLIVSGEFFADEERLTILADDWGTIVFPYRFEHGRLKLFYEGREIELS